MTKGTMAEIVKEPAKVRERRVVEKRDTEIGRISASVVKGTWVRDETSMGFGYRAK